MAADPCDCGSGQTYAACCRPFHRAEKAPGTPGQLMRARFTAFARKEISFLAGTLDAAHPDARQPKDEQLRSLRQAASRLKYVRLRVLEERGDEVLFHAELYERGKECSFLERSSFARSGPQGAWAYVGGEAKAWPAARADQARWDDVSS
jgi:SEC-C motif domain protein